MNLTVGKIEELLRPFSKGTEVSLNCGCCHHGSIGNEDILKVRNYTNQTYGYIELEFNANSQGKVELNPNEKEWYEGEIQKLKEQNKKLKEIIEVYKDEFKDIDMTLKVTEKRINYIK